MRADRENQNRDALERCDVQSGDSVPRVVTSPLEVMPFESWKTHCLPSQHSVCMSVHGGLAIDTEDLRGSLKSSCATISSRLWQAEALRRKKCRFQSRCLPNVHPAL
mmetsp:Transcript_27115/g.55238  ORF Transcript_27115/g.55238 Transcript_27115/m.55238 type:complete len:107 (+) Transcript_27115:131-451(+)